MGQSYRSISPQELQDMKKATPGDQKFFLAHGYLSGAQGALVHQRAVLLTHQETIQRYLVALNRGLDIGTALIDGQTSKVGQRELQNAVKRVARLDNAQKKKEDEKQRKTLLTAEQLDQEKRENAQQAAARKQRKIEEDERARRLVEPHKISH